MPKLYRGRSEITQRDEDELTCVEGQGLLIVFGEGIQDIALRVDEPNHPPASFEDRHDDF